MWFHNDTPLSIITTLIEFTWSRKKADDLNVIDKLSFVDIDTQEWWKECCFHKWPLISPKLRVVDWKKFYVGRKEYGL
eukprot:UN03289